MRITVSVVALEIIMKQSIIVHWTQQDSGMTSPVGVFAR